MNPITKQTRSPVILLLGVLLAMDALIFAEAPEAKKPPVFKVTVKLTEIPLVPNPHNNVYAECVVVAEATVEQQPKEQRQLPHELLVAFWGFRERKLMPAADYEPGTRLELELIPFGMADEEVRTAQRLSEVEESGAPLLWARSARLVPVE